MTDPNPSPSVLNPPILPMVLSELMEMGLQDLEIGRADPEVEINLAMWHYKESGQPCKCCLAGLAMKYRLNFGLSALKGLGDTLVSPALFPRNKRQLEAISDASFMQFSNALIVLGHHDKARRWNAACQSVFRKKLDRVARGTDNALDTYYEQLGHERYVKIINEAITLLKSIGA